MNRTAAAIATFATGLVITSLGMSLQKPWVAIVTLLGALLTTTGPFLVFVPSGRHGGRSPAAGYQEDTSTDRDA